MAADLNLDDFLVFENNQNKATNFFKNLIFKHYSITEDALPEIDSPDKFIQISFTQTPVFEEMVRAVEGVPRDALNLAAKIASRAFGQKIAMQHVRVAARDWYQQDKASVIKGSEELSELLDHIITEVIGARRARAFLFASNVRDERIDQLFDSRLLHVLKKTSHPTTIPAQDMTSTRLTTVAMLILSILQKCPKVFLRQTRLARSISLKSQRTTTDQFAAPY